MTGSEPMIIDEQIQNLKYQLKRKDALIEEKNSELNNYFFTVSHELKTPLTAMSGYISLLEQFYGNTITGEAAKYFSRISNNLGRMQQLVEDLVEFSKVQIIENEYERIEFHHILNEAILELQYGLMQKSVKINTSDNFPQLYCQRKLITRVLINLIGNGIKYSRPKISPEITVGYVGTEIFHKFYVKDNGIGIAKKEQSRLFQMFSRLENNKGIKGSGLGLAIVKRIIEGHGGEIWVESRKNKGSTFYFTLPKYYLNPS